MKTRLEKIAEAEELTDSFIVSGLLEEDLKKINRSLF